MSRRCGLSLVLAALSIGFLQTLPLQAARPALPELRPSGARLVDASGNTVLLKGTNVGNWFLFERWMMGGHAERGPLDHVSLIRMLEERFGKRRAAEVLDAHRESWIGRRDFALMREVGFNAVRVPFHHGLVEDPENAGQLSESGVRWLDHAVHLAAEAGLYVILDLHGAPGSQSIDHVTGERNRNEFWLPANRARAASLWRGLAERYRDNPAVAAYDLLNEPYGRLDASHDDEALVTAMSELVAAVREVDPHTLIYVAGSLRGIEFYGPPSKRGWKGVGFTEHFYPGLFGDESSLRSMARFLQLLVPSRAELLARWDVPFLVGEFNPVLHASGGAPMLRMHFDAFAQRGWAATSWSWKMIREQGGADPQPWSFVVNRDPVATPDFEQASDREIEAYFRSAASFPYALSQPQIDALRAERFRPIDLPTLRQPVWADGASAPESDGWELFDVGDAFPRAEVRRAGTLTQVRGGGRDIFAQRDEFALWARRVDGDCELSSTVAFESDEKRFAKAGLMWRARTDAESPLVMLHRFRDGSVVIASRLLDGQRIREQTLALSVPEAAKFELRRRGDRFTAVVHMPDGPVEATLELAGLARTGWAGAFVLSHDGAVLQQAGFGDLSVKDAAR